MPRPRRQRLSREAAVSASPLFDLPLEIRLMIYKLLLVQDDGVAIAHDAFKRIKSPRDSNRPCICTASGVFFTNNANLANHIRSIPPYIRGTNQVRGPEPPDLPNMNTMILHTCRLIHDEATPILYQFNSFCFSDPTTAETFHWSIASKYACSIQEIGFNCAITYHEPCLWKELSEYFPHLKRMSLRLNWWQRHDIDRQLEELARHFRGLDWVQIHGSGSVRCLEVLNPIIERDSNTGLMHVQKHVAVSAAKDLSASSVFHELLANSNLRRKFSTVWMHRVRWDSIWWTTQWRTTLWWGCDGEQPPESSRPMLKGMEPDHGMTLNEIRKGSP